MKTTTTSEQRSAADFEIGQSCPVDSHAQLRAELRCLDLRIERELRGFRAERSKPVDEFLIDQVLTTLIEYLPIPLARL